MKLLLLITFSLHGLCSGANILFLSPISSKSHMIFFNGVIDGLSKKGHKVSCELKYIHISVFGYDLH